MVQNSKAERQEIHIFEKTNDMNHLRHLAAAISGCLCIAAASAQSHNIPFENGTLTLTPLQDNAVRIRYSEGEIKEMPEWIYTENVGKVKCRRTEKDGKSIFQLSAMTVTAAKTIFLIIPQSFEKVNSCSINFHE